MTYQERKQAHLQRRQDLGGLPTAGIVELEHVRIPTYLRAELETLAGVRRNQVSGHSSKLLSGYLTEVLEAHVERLEGGS
jgi:hypothetical protein